MRFNLEDAILCAAYVRRVAMHDSQEYAAAGRVIRGVSDPPAETPAPNPHSGSPFESAFTPEEVERIRREPPGEPPAPLRYCRGCGLIGGRCDCFIGPTFAEPPNETECLHDWLNGECRHCGHFREDNC